nr:NAD(P)-dependent oxidoreductase [Tessaracoccus coleopterorum]
MLGTGGHVRVDIPQFIAEALEAVPGSTIDYATHLGPDPRLVDAVRHRIAAVMGTGFPPTPRSSSWGVARWCPTPTPTTSGSPGCTSRREAGRGRARFHPGDSAQPAGGARPHLRGRGRRIVVMGHWLFPGRLRTWTHEQSAAWAAAHPDAQVRVAEVIGACDELAHVVADRYRETLLDAPGRAPRLPQRPAAGGRRVVVVGGGAVSTRRVPRLLDSGADVTLISPTVTPVLEALAADGRLAWERRGYAQGDVAGAWYVLAQTDDPRVNALIAAEAEEGRTFCVRADDATGGSAWTAITMNSDGVTVGVLGSRDPVRSRGVRDALLASVRSALSREAS